MSNKKAPALTGAVLKVTEQPTTGTEPGQGGIRSDCREGGGLAFDLASFPGTSAVTPEGGVPRAGGSQVHPGAPLPGDAGPLGYMGISGLDSRTAWNNSDVNPADATVYIHAHGTVTKGAGKAAVKPPKGGGKRGAIREWSAKSRGRLRQTLAVTTGPEGWKVQGWTGTIPGPVIEPDTFRNLWRYFLRHLRRYAPDTVAGLWRVELQRRLQPHVHAVLWYPPWDNPFAKIIAAWSKACEAIPFPPGWKWPEDESGSWQIDWDRIAMKGGYEAAADPDVKRVKTRMTMKGACLHASSFTEDIGEDDFGWWQYLAAHAGKKKQDQLGWVGRNWGKLNAHLLRETTATAYNLSRRQWFRFRRLMRRLLGYRGAPGGRRSVYYARPATVSAMAEWCRSEASGII